MKKIRLQIVTTAIFILFLTACSTLNGTSNMQEKNLVDRIIFFSDRDKLGQIYSMSPDGKDLTNLQFELPAGIRITNLKWSEPAQKWVFTGLSANQSDIYVANYDGKNVINVTKTPDQYEDEGAISLDGKRVAYIATSTGTNTILFTQKTDGSDLKQANEFPMKEAQPDWLDDGTRLTLISSKEGSPNVFELDITKDALNNLSAGKGFDDDPALAYDRSFFVFTSDRAGMTNIFKYNFKSKEIIQLTKDMEYASSGRPSPDGKMVVFRSKKDGSDLYLVKLGDLSVSRLTNTPETAELLPNWSADSQKVLFSADNQGKTNIYTVGIDGQITNLSSASENDYGAMWVRLKP